MSKAKNLATFGDNVDSSGNLTDLNVDSNTLVVDTANNRVGIGTAPNKKLHVYRNDTSTDAQILVEQAGIGDATVNFLKTGVYAWMTGIDNTDNKYKISGTGDNLNTNNYLAIDTNGNVGIGTDTPLYKLDINGIVSSTVGTNTRTFAATDGTQYVSLVADLGNGGYNGLSTAGDVGIIFTTDGDNTTDEAGKGLVIAPWASGAKGIKIQEDGKVGIGTTSPTTTLDVNGSIQDDQGNVRALEVTVVNSTPYTVASGSSGKYFALTTGSSVVTINNSNFAIGDIITFYNRLATTATINFSGTTYVHIVGNGTAVTSVTLAAYGLCTLIYDRAGVIIINGNVS